MGRFLRHHPEYLMAAFVMVLVVGLALAPSAGMAVTLGPETPAVVSATAPDERPWFDLGMEVWDARCYSCHADLEYIPELFLADNGRTYLLELMLFGVRGEVVIEGAPTNLRHRSYASLDDEQPSAVLNLMPVAWGNDEALPADVDFYTPEEVAAARTPERSNERAPTGSSSSSATSEAEPPHVHVQRDRLLAKFWLAPITLARSTGFSPQELRAIAALVEAHAEAIMEAWHAHFDG